MKKVAILQSNYIPWKGYFDIINLVDEFILYDDMQYTRRDWRNRNLIKTNNGLQWITIPVVNKGKYYQKINETQVSNSEWCDSHWKTFCSFYSKSKYFSTYKNTFQDLYNKCESESYISKINYQFIMTICDILNIKTNITFSSDYKLVDGKTERLIGLCKDLDADIYLSGPAAKDYIVDEMFQQSGIQLAYMDYSNYPTYTQLFDGFEHGVTVLDLIFNEGPNAFKYMKSFDEKFVDKLFS